MNTSFEDARVIRKPADHAFQPLNSQLVLFVFFATHVPLAILMRTYTEVATAHALATLALGLWWMVSRRRPDRAIYVAAYITGAEVLWRMVGANIFYEFGKYAVSLIFIVGILRTRRLRAPIPILVYFLLLLPSAGILLADTDLLKARSDISFNLSGPFTLMISAWFFSRLTLPKETLVRLFTALIGPLIAVAWLTFYATLTARGIHFTDESNFVTSGGFGPNQVSAMLGLGVVLCFVSLLEGSLSSKIKVVMLGLLIVFAVQSALTFSRGGLFMAFVTSMLTSLFLIKERRARIRLVVLGTLLFVVGSYVVLPKLEGFTRGNFVTRFRNIAPTQRDVIIADDLKTWEEHPLFGVGPGQAKFRHRSFRLAVAAHTEYSRLVAEHGVFGFAALVLLIVTSVRTITGASSPEARVVKVMVISWGFLFMLADAMRLAAPAFLVGLAFADLFPEAVKIKDRYRLRWQKYLSSRAAPELPGPDIQLQ